MWAFIQPNMVSHIVIAFDNRCEYILKNIFVEPLILSYKQDYEMYVRDIIWYKEFLDGLVEDHPQAKLLLSQLDYIHKAVDFSDRFLAEQKQTVVKLPRLPSVFNKTREDRCLKWCTK